MPRFLLTYVSLFIFACTMIWVNRGDASIVSQETPASVYHETFSVKRGLSSDGQLRIEQIFDAPTVPHHAQFANHMRNLRVYIAPDRSGVPTLYLEQVKPHNFFAISGPILVAPFSAKFMWTDQTTFLFYATSSEGIFMTHSINVHDLSYHASVASDDVLSLAAQVVVD